MRDLRTSEKKGTLIKHKTFDSIVKIIGTDLGGFRVIDQLRNNPFPLFLPFKNMNFWQVMEEDDLKTRRDENFCLCWLSECDCQFQRHRGLFTLCESHEIWKICVKKEPLNCGDGD